MLLENPRVPASLLCSRQMHLNGASSAKCELPSLILLLILFIFWVDYDSLEPLENHFSSDVLTTSFHLMICQKTALELPCIFGRVSEQLATQFIHPITNKTADSRGFFSFSTNQPKHDARSRLHFVLQHGKSSEMQSSIWTKKSLLGCHDCRVRGWMNVRTSKK